MLEGDGRVPQQDAVFLLPIRCWQHAVRGQQMHPDHYAIYYLQHTLTRCGIVETILM